MKHSIALLFLLATFWMTSSGYFNGFLLSTGALSCLLAVWISRRMGIVDDESVPVQIGVIPMGKYLWWLIKQIALSNKALIKTVLNRRLEIKRAMFRITTAPRSSIGKVIMANSITLTPGTVTTSIDDESMQIHALVDPGLNDPTILEIDRRVRDLEGL